MTEPMIHPATVPSSLTADELRLRSDAAGGVAVDPRRAGWRYLSFRTIRLAGGAAVALDPRQEHAIVVIEGADASVAGGAKAIAIEGRPSPFSALPAACYVPAGAPATVRTEGPAGAASLIAIASAPPSGREDVASEAQAIGRADVRIEIRGAGNASRQINHIIEPDFPADRLEIVEVVTPSGNWSSWPPHKHDTDDMPAEAVLEEVYYYRFGRPAAWGMQRLYRAGRSRDCTWEVGTGDVVLVTDGYHPFVAAQGDDAYYLNALAGDRRTMACSFDPALDWVRREWSSLPPDPRLPLVTR
jgi:5-deoxy-glucuronate isomerase